MGVIQRQTIKSTVYIYTGVLVGFVTTALIFPRVLTSAQIGLITLLASWSAVFAQFATLGFGGATVKFFPSFRNSQKNHHGFLFLLLIVTLSGFILFLGLFLVLRPWLFSSHENAPLFQDKIYLILPFTFFVLCFLALDIYNRVLYNATTGALLKEVALRLLILTGIAALFFNLLNFDEFIFWYVGAQGAILIMLIAFLIWQGDFNPIPNFSLLNRTMMENLASLSLFSFLTGFSSLAIMRIDSIMIGKYLSEAAVGIYTLNLYFGTLVLLPSRALRNIAPTLIADAFVSNDLNTIKNIYQKSTITQLVVGLFLMLGIWTNTETIYIILTPEYREGIYVLLFIGLSNVVRMAGGLSDAVVGYSDYYKMNTVFNAGWLILIVATNIVFIPQMGITGAALASLISVFVITIVRYWFVYQKFGIQPYEFKHITVVFLAVVTYALIKLLPTFSPFWIDLIVRGSLVILLYGASVYFLNISAEINGIIDLSLKRIQSLF